MIKEQPKLIIVMLALMTKARWLGVPRTLANLPFLWLPIRKTSSLDGEAILRNIDLLLDQFLNRKIGHFLFSQKRRCLSKGLVLAWYAKKLGMEAILHFGVRIKKRRLKGHCWISYPHAEKMNGDKASGDYLEIWQYPIV
jgi:hypothetical protein